MFVSTPWVGSAISHRRAISPSPLMPISMTAASWREARRSSVCGTPMWLLRLPSVFNVINRSARMAAIMSLVVVLPLLPLTATTGMSNRRRCACARS